MNIEPPPLSYIYEKKYVALKNYDGSVAVFVEHSGIQERIQLLKQGAQVFRKEIEAIESRVARFDEERALLEAFLENRTVNDAEAFNVDAVAEFFQEKKHPFVPSEEKL